MNYSTSRHLIVLSLQCLFVVAGNPFDIARAQDLDNASISGRIMDQNGAITPGASVSVVLMKSSATRSTVTDSEGRYRLIQLEPGNYTLRVSLSGFATQEVRDLTSFAGQSLQLDLKLFPQNLVTGPVVIVAADSQVVDTTRSVVGATITVYEAESLPVLNRSALDLMFVLPGVSEEPLSTRDLAEDRNITPANTPEEAGTFSLSGGPAYSNNLTIEGMDNNDDRAARERFQPSIEAIEEVQVVANQFSAEYGRASGGRVNIRTRKGSTLLRGRAFYFFRDEALNANTFNNNSLGLARLPLQEHNPGFTLGGPVGPPSTRLGARTFFFTAYEVDRVLDSALIDTLVPVRRNNLFPLPGPTIPTASRLEDAASPALATEIAPFVSSVSTPFRNSILTARIDHQFNSNHDGSLLYQLGRLNNLRGFGGGNRLAEALQAKTRNSDAIAYSDNYIFSPTLVNQVRMQYSRLLPALKARDANTPVVLVSIKDSLARDDSGRRSGTLIAGSSTTGATDRREERFQFQNVLAYVRGDHSLKFGVDTQRIHSTFIDLSDASGTFNFASAGDFLAGIPSRFRQNFQTESTQRNTYLGFFLQDEWQPRLNLFVTVGLRYEMETIVRDLNNFGPRFSVAFDPFNSGKTVIRTGFGVFYNRVLLRTVDDFTLGAQQLFFDTNMVRDPVTGILLGSDHRRTFIDSHLQFPRTLRADSPLVKQFGVFNDRFSRRLDPGLRIPESYQGNLGVERDLGHGFIVEANFTLNRGLHLWREFNANAPILPNGYKNFTEYLASQDFPNFRSGTGIRPIYNASSAGELVRFVLNPPNAANPNSIVNIVEFGVPVSLINLNSFTSTTSVETALAALLTLRPDPGRVEVEQLISAGNSFYKGLSIEVRRRLNQKKAGLGFSFRASYTFSYLKDDGIVNTSDALSPGDFRAERARSLLDRRHRFVFSGTLDLPRHLGKLRLGSIWRVTSGAPFNISIGGADRNLDDVGNDRPSFSGDLELLHWRRPGQTIAPSLLTSFSLPTIGQSGDLPRNAGQGPGQFLLDLNLARDFHINDRVKLRPVIELDNVLNKTIFSFGSEFINFNTLSPSASPEQRQDFLNSFLIATRTLRPRQVRLGLRFDF